jgi:HEAT repeat protein
MQLAVSGNIDAVSILLRWYDEAYLRNIADKALEQAGEKLLIPLTGILSSNTSPVELRIAAAHHVGMNKLVGALDVLVRMLEDRDPKLIRAAAAALGSLADLRATPALVRLLNHNDSSIVGEAAGALERIADPSLVEPLTKALNNENSSCRMLIVHALQRINHPSALAPLVDRLKNDPDTKVRASAARAVATVGRAVGDAQAVLPALLCALSDSNQFPDGVCVSAISALGTLKSHDAVPSLVSLLAQKPGIHVRKQAIQALGDIGDQRGVAAITAQLQGYVPDEIKWCAQGALQKLRETQS